MSSAFRCATYHFRPDQSQIWPRPLCRWREGVPVLEDDLCTIVDARGIPSHCKRGCSEGIVSAPPLVVVLSWEAWIDPILDCDFVIFSL